MKIEPIDHTEKVFKVPPTHHSGAISPPCQGMAKQVMNVPEGGSTEAGGLQPVRAIATVMLKRCQQDSKYYPAGHLIKRASYSRVRVNALSYSSRWTENSIKLI